MKNNNFCSYFDQRSCRSCKWIEQDYSSQIIKKEEQIRDALSFFQIFHLEKSVQSSLQGFRNRAKMSVTGSVETSVIGLLGQNNDSLDEGREILACPIHHEKLNQIIAALPELIRVYNLIPYIIQERKGELKGVIAFYSQETNQAYLRFILRSKECVARLKKLVPVFQKQFPEVVCITANIQPVPHAIQEGPEEIFLTETRAIDLQLGSLCLKLTPQAFVQTNIHVATALYETAARWIQEAEGVGNFLELFCGQGAFSLVAAQSLLDRTTRFLGIEINGEAVKAANETAKRLGLGHVLFRASDATQVASEIEDFQPDLVLVNPPRRGLAQGALILKQATPRYIIYSSCSIETLARDLRILSEKYNIRKIQLFDMFPHTEHFETLVWLQIKS
jgi:23S rRNA (uracil747-C5)-methyltransferase